MREIKFRGRRKDGKWRYGDLIHNRGGVYIADDSVVDGTDIQGHTDFSVIPESVGQYTGLKDAQGKEIYEGDILSRYFYRDKYIIREVHWHRVYAAWYARDQFGDKPLYFNSKSESIECEVVGNIHDNPELMKGGER